MKSDRLIHPAALFFIGFLIAPFLFIVGLFIPIFGQLLGLSTIIVMLLFFRTIGVTRALSVLCGVTLFLLAVMLFASGIPRAMNLLLYIGLTLGIPILLAVNFGMIAKIYFSGETLGADLYKQEKS
jgi:hypothetical protein